MPSNALQARGADTRTLAEYRPRSARYGLASRPEHKRSLVTDHTSLPHTRRRMNHVLLRFHLEGSTRRAQQAKAQTPSRILAPNVGS